MSLRRVSVRREEHPRMSLFGAQRWWGVWLTPFQQVASFANRIDALNWAGLVALSHQPRCGLAWTSPTGDHHCGGLAGHPGVHRCREHPGSFVASDAIAEAVGWHPRWGELIDGPPDG